MVIERFGKNHQPDPATGQARPTPLSSSDVFLLMNGGKDGNRNEFLKPFAGIKKEVKNITLFRDEKSSCQRRGKVQGFATLNCVETLLVVQAGKSKLKKVTYDHFPSCSTHSNMLGPILMPPFNQLWSLPWKFKRELFGKREPHFGGEEGGDKAEELDSNPNRNPESVEPVFYHGFPTIVYQDILQAHQVRYCIDLTPGDGAAALASYKLGIFYLGLTFTTTHTEQLSAKLKHEILQAMANENDDLHSAALVQTLLHPEPRGRKRSRPDDSEDGCIEPAIDEEESSSDDEDSSQETLPSGHCPPCHLFQSGFFLDNKKRKFIMLFIDNIDFLSIFPSSMMLVVAFFPAIPPLIHPYTCQEA